MLTLSRNQYFFIHRLDKDAAKSLDVCQERSPLLNKRKKSSMLMNNDLGLKDSHLAKVICRIF